MTLKLIKDRPHINLETIPGSLWRLWTEEDLREAFFFPPPTRYDKSRLVKTLSRGGGYQLPTLFTWPHTCRLFFIPYNKNRPQREKTLRRQTYRPRIKYSLLRIFDGCFVKMFERREKLAAVTNWEECFFFRIEYKLWSWKLSPRTLFCDHLRVSYC
jgi:hypothetical protein